MPPSKPRDDFWLFALLGLVAVAVLVAFLFRFAGEADRSTMRREQAVVSNGVSATVSEIGRLVIPQAVWDDAVVHLDNKFDPAWAADNIGQFLWSVDKFDFAYVLDASERPIYGMRAGENVDPMDFEGLRDDAVKLMAQVRAAEAARAVSGAAISVGDNIQASAIRDTPDGLVVLTATLVQPDFGKAKLRGPQAPIIFTGRAVGAAFVDQLAARYMLQNAHMHDGDMRAEGDDAHIGLMDNDGAVVGTLDWTPQTPGANLLKTIIPWVLAFVGLMAVLTAILYRRAGRAASSLRESEARATHMAHHDALTGIANRMRLEQRLAEAQAQRFNGGSVAILHIDLDGFKELNDTHGHLAGDELLRAVAGRLKNQCREGDVFARLGGDEFAVLQYPGDERSAQLLGERIMEVVRRPFQLSSGAFRIGCSIGIAASTNPDADRLELLRQSDLALYDAKDKGKGRISFFQAEMDSAVRERAVLRDELRKAMSVGELQMVYQPQVDRSNRIVGMEALLRWQHPTRGAVSPALFVPIAEQAGMMGELGEYTIRRTFSDCRRWPGMRVAINVSPSMIRTPGFAGRLRSLAREYGVEPAMVEVELTEGVVLNDNPEVQKTLSDLRAAGFTLALDDFGTGYSSLSYLQRFPIDKIKIDRSFIANLDIDEEADAVVTAIVQLAKALNLSVIAEGVETDVQRQRLLSIGCSDVQGFLAYRPMSADGVEKVLRQPMAA